MLPLYYFIRLFLVIVELLQSLACTLVWSRQRPQASDFRVLGLDTGLLELLPGPAIRSARKLFLSPFFQPNNQTVPVYITAGCDPHLPFCGCWCLLLNCRKHIFFLSVRRCCSARFAVLPLSVVGRTNSSRLIPCVPAFLVKCLLFGKIPSWLILFLFVSDQCHGLAENEFMPAFWKTSGTRFVG